MKMSRWFSVALAGAVISTAAMAGNGVVSRDTAAMHAEQASQRALTSRHAAAPPATGAARGFARSLGQGLGGENGPYANPYRAYPPSCMADPLPANTTGPVLSKDVDLAAYSPDLDGYVRETVTVMLWRVPCSSAKSPHSITLMRIQRDAAHEGDTSQYIVFPSVRVAQGDIQFDDANGDDLVRIATEPNTVIASVITDSPMVYSTTYVLENYPIAGTTLFDFNQAFQLRLDNFFTAGTRQYVLDMPAYNPTTSSYPTAFEPLPINGYMSSDYYDTAHSGEGIFLQVFENQRHGEYILQLSWFTFGPDGRPLWLTGDAVLEPGTRTLTVAIRYRDDGGFAGNFGPIAGDHPWGTLTLSFPDCNHLKFSYQSDAGLPSWLPQGSGTRTWGRLADVNGLTCE